MGKLTDEERADAAQAHGDTGTDDPGVRKAAAELLTFPNAYSSRDYVVTIETAEFTAICPMTGQPDFGRMEIEYVPDERVLELKSLKLYLWSYRNEGAFHEAVTNQIVDDLVGALKPRWLEVIGEFMVRGGITTEVHVTYP